MLLSFLLVNGIGFYVYFYFRLESIHQEMKAALMNCPDSKLQKISFSIAQYQLAKKDEGEIKWNGQMYDVAKTETQDGRVIVFALRDDLETELMAFLKLVEGATDNHKPPAALMHYLSLVFIMPAHVTPSYAPEPSYLKHFFFYTFHHRATTVEVISPPPRA